MSAAHPHRDGLVIAPLGGCGEIGMNLTLYGAAGKWLMVDCGMTFADESLPGIDLIVPDPAFIETEAEDLVGLVITHAHEDHIGAVHHLWERFRCDVWVTPFAAQSLYAKLDEAGLRDDVTVRIFEGDAAIELDPFRITPVGLTHSTLEMQALAIETRHGTVLHTGDWKLDADPLIGPKSDEVALKAWGDKGVLALVCDSTNVFDPGTSGSEADVRKSLIELVKARPNNRVVVTTFASNVARIESVARAAEASGREFVLVGRSLWKFWQAARAVGYLEDVKAPLTDKDAARMPRHKTLMLCTGCQGEPRGAMARIAMDDHPSIDLRAGDTAIFSSKIIPGNERTLYRMHNAMALNDVEVITEKDHFVHVSGHPAREELKRMYELVRPEILVPVHGEARHLIEQARFAVEEGGVNASQVILNGDVLRLAPGQPEIVSEVPVGRLAVDPAGLVVTASAMLQHRRKLAGNGVMMLVLVVDEESELVEDPRILLVGVAEGAELGRLRGDISVAIDREVAKVNGRRPADDDTLAEAATRAARRVVRQIANRRPITECEIVRLEEGEQVSKDKWKEAV
ncbi:MAG: ribonuclease J [Minwuia sp.]|uniref:ribonuclease J n=1 Tax=Minwuia sp. TaxID=2493630 RepID=UPI003A87F163